jgi:hypothetical protein
MAIWFSTDRYLPEDFQESTVPAFAIAHGAFSCAYPQTAHSPIPPLYPLLAGATMAISRIGDMRFPQASDVVDHCPSAYVSTLSWGSPVLVLWLIGLLGWPVLLAGFVLLIRASGVYRRRLALAGVSLIAIAPPVAGTLIQEFHPEDLFAIGLILGAMAAAIRNRWMATGILMGLACCSKQYALLAALPLLVVAPSQDRRRFVVGAGGAGAIILVPIVLACGRGALAAIVGATATPTDGNTLISMLDFDGPMRVFASRVVPLVLATILALLARRRLQADIYLPSTLTALVSTSLALRLLFEVNVFDYYLMALSVALVAADVVGGRIRVETVGWIVIAGLAFPPRFELLQTVTERFTVPMQVVVALTGLVVAAIPLRRSLHSGSEFDHGQASGLDGSTMTTHGLALAGARNVNVSAVSRPSLPGTA